MNETKVTNFKTSIIPIHFIAIGSCNLVQFEQELPPLYQNMVQVPGIDAKKLGTIGGSVMLADFCPYIQEFTWRSNGATKVHIKKMIITFLFLNIKIFFKTKAN